MRKTLLTFSLLLAVSTCFGQYLTLDQLISFQNKDLNTVTSFFFNRGWQFTNTSLGEAGSHSNATWCLRNGNNGIAFFDFFTKDGYENRIAYHVISKQQFSLLKSRAVALGMKNVDSKIEENAIDIHYVGKNYAVIFRTSSTNDIVLYSVMVYKKDDYLTNMFFKYNNSSSENIKQESFLFQTSFDNPIAEVSLMEKPHWDSKQIYVCPKNATVYVMETGELYYKVFVNGYIGYISQALLKRKSM